MQSKISPTHNPADTFSGVPAISTFFGIVIRMYRNDHRPPHFHAEYHGRVGRFTFSGEMIAGQITSLRARRLIRTWARHRRVELEENWERAQRNLPAVRIAPLE